MPAGDSPALRAVRRTVVSQPPGRRFLYLAASAHLLGSVLNIAGMILLSTMVARQDDAVLQRRMASALLRSFVAASTWSPFFVSTVVVLVALPELGLPDVLAIGLPLGAVCLVMAWLFDRLRLRRPASAAAAPPGAPLSGWDGRSLVGIFGALAVLVIGGVEATGLSLPVVLGLIAPPFGVIWMVLIEGPARPPLRRAGRLALTVLGRLDGLRNEALAFTVSSLVGVGFAAGFPAEAVAGHLAAGTSWIIFGQVFGMLALGAIGIHPVVPAFIVGEALPPEVLGLPPEIVAMCLLAAWGLATHLSPVSGTTLMMARFVPASSYAIAWRWNPAYVLATATVLTLFVYAVWRMQLG